MPTYEQVARFMAEYARLTPEQRRTFRRAITLFREGLETGQFHPSLGVKGFRSEPRRVRTAVGKGRPGPVGVRQPRPGP